MKGLKFFLFSLVLSMFIGFGFNANAFVDDDVGDNIEFVIDNANVNVDVIVMTSQNALSRDVLVCPIQELETNCTLTNLEKQMLHTLIAIMGAYEVSVMSGWQYLIQLLTTDEGNVWPMKGYIQLIGVTSYDMNL